MIDEENGLAVEIEAESPETPEIVVEETPSAPEPERISEAEAVEELKRQLAVEKQHLAAEKQRHETERLRAERAEQMAAARGNEVEDANLRLVSNAIDMLESNSKILIQNYTDAMTNADYANAAHYQNEMAANQSKLLQLQQGLEAMRNKPREVVNPPVDPVEALASRLSPRSASWIRAHPEYARDALMFKKMQGAHNLAEGEGIVLDSDEYYNFIETTLKIRQPLVDIEAPMEHAAQKRPVSPASAPVTRSSGTNPRTMRLTGEEVEFAKLNKMTPEEYARQKLAIQRGK
jgi:hypothetical protein